MSNSPISKEDKGKAPEDVAMGDTGGGKKVKFAEDTKPPASGASTPSGATTPQVKKEPAEDEAKISGMVGQMEIYESGTVKMRLGNGILLDVRVNCSHSSDQLFTTVIYFRLQPPHNRPSYNMQYIWTPKASECAYSVR